MNLLSRLLEFFKLKKNKKLASEISVLSSVNEEFVTVNLSGVRDTALRSLLLDKLEMPLMIYFEDVSCINWILVAQFFVSEEDTLDDIDSVTSDIDHIISTTLGGSGVTRILTSDKQTGKRRLIRHVF